MSVPCQRATVYSLFHSWVRRLTHRFGYNPAFLEHLLEPTIPQNESDVGCRSLWGVVGSAFFYWVSSAVLSGKQRIDIISI